MAGCGARDSLLHFSLSRPRRLKDGVPELLPEFFRAVLSLKAPALSGDSIVTAASTKTMFAGCCGAGGDSDEVCACAIPHPIVRVRSKDIGQALRDLHARPPVAGCFALSMLLPDQMQLATAFPTDRRWPIPDSKIDRCLCYSKFGGYLVNCFTDALGFTAVENAAKLQTLPTANVPALFGRDPINSASERRLPCLAVNVSLRGPYCRRTSSVVGKDPVVVLNATT
jgi:hypothetical protein